MTALKWTDEPPKEPGWYWLRTTRRTIVCQVMLDQDGQLEIDWLPQNERLAWLNRWLGCQWAGPIPEPEE